MAGSIHQQIINNSNQTEIIKQSQPKEASKTVDGDTFLQLLTKQLQYQDPMNPMDNTDMLAQEAQFAALEQMEALTSSFSQFSTMFQANSLIGQTVEVKVSGEDAVVGKVDYVDYTDSKGASISIGGKLYPISSVTKVTSQEIADDSNKTDEDKSFFKDAISAISDNIGSIAKKVGEYAKNENTTTTPTTEEI